MSRDPALLRFLAIQLVRVAGVAAAVTGLMVLAGRLAWPAPAGIALTLAGLVAALLAPVRLARRWKSPEE